MIIVSDTTSLNHLALIGHHQLLNALFGKVLIPPAVAFELSRGQEKNAAIGEIVNAPWIEVRALEHEERADELAMTLDRGEAEAIILAMELNCLLLIDDLPGRRFALSLGLKITGTLGVLLAAKKQKLLPVISPVIQKMIQEHHFRVSQSLFEQTLKEAGE